MPKPYSQDLRDRVIDAVERGEMSRRAAARRYAISESVAIKWLERVERDGSREHSSLRPLYHLAVTRIEISAAAYAALAASATRGLLEPRRSPEGGYSIWLAPKALKRLEAVRGPSESYSDAILRLAEMETTDQWATILFSTF